MVLSFKLFYSKGKLDCLRDNPKPPKETLKQRELRLAANWDSDCSFESESSGSIINKLIRLSLEN